MCGIFGVITNSPDNYSSNIFRDLVNRLFLLSESRGKEASGFAIGTNSEIVVFKAPESATNLIKLKKYKDLFEKSLHDARYATDDEKVWSFIGHSRLVTNGPKNTNENNQPVVKEGIIGFHNGIITNDEDLWKKYPDLVRDEKIDTEVLLALINKNFKDAKSFSDSIKSGFNEIEGNSSVALLFEGIKGVFLATNTGSIYYAFSDDQKILIFASENYIISEIFKDRRFNKIWGKNKINQIKSNFGCFVKYSDMEIKCFSLECDKTDSDDENIFNSNSGKYRIIDNSTYSPPEGSNVDIGNRDNIRKIILNQPNPHEIVKRCSKCLLPSTFPGISFDEKGVCNYCNNYVKTTLKDERELKKFVYAYKKEDGTPDCLIGFSGGRDSSYVMYYVVNELRMNPIAFTYDWGMVTDLARRNCSRVTGKLGVEHIIVSADIERKRANIRKNLQAWLKKPDLGMIPILMAGDKQFYYHAHKLMKQTEINLVLGGATPYEKTDFKLGFCGIGEDDTRGKGLLTGIKIKNKIKLCFYYLKQYLMNPAYINTSIFDTMHAFYSAYILPDAYLNIYDYVAWDEQEIKSLLIFEYNWEIATDTSTTWRIGDGTAAFYNYIYYTIAGFTENDTFRSNQIREGVITRDEGLKLIEEENRPRIESLMWYAEIVGFNLEEALNIIHSTPKIWKKA